MRVTTPYQNYTGGGKAVRDRGAMRFKDLLTGGDRRPYRVYEAKMLTDDSLVLKTHQAADGTVVTERFANVEFSTEDIDKIVEALKASGRFPSV